MKNMGNSQDINLSFRIQWTPNEEKSFPHFESLRTFIEDAFHLNEDDPFIFNLHYAIQLIDDYEENLFNIVGFRRKDANDLVDDLVLRFQHGTNISDVIELYPVRIDICSCQRLLQCPNGTTTLSPGSTSSYDCISRQNDILRRVSMIPPSTSNVSDKISRHSEIGKRSFLALKAMEIAVFNLNLTQLPNNMTYGRDYRLAIYNGCEPCPLRYECDLSQHSKCSYPSLEEQDMALNNCLSSNRINVCVHRNGSTVDTAWCEKFSTGVYPRGHPQAGKSQDSLYIETPTSIEDQAAFNLSFLFFTEPDIQKCLSLPLFCTEKEWNYMTFRRLCQDQTTGEIYDCSISDRWKAFFNWSSKLCCSDHSDFEGMLACVDDNCSESDHVQKVLREKYISVFEMEHGYELPEDKPMGSFLFDKKLQEARDDPYPILLFNEWDVGHEVQTNNIFSHTKKKPWLKKEGCCNCQTHPLSSHFTEATPKSGYPDDKHQHIQLTISALENVEVMVVVELLHGQFYHEFDAYFESINHSSLFIHTPSRVSDKSDRSVWHSLLEKNSLKKYNIHLPLNLHSQISKQGSILVDTPCGLPLELRENVTKGLDAIERNKSLSTFYDDDGREGRFTSCSNKVFNKGLQSSSPNVIHGDEASISLRYLPFFSNCDNYGSHMSLSRLLEDHPQCTIVDTQNTRAVHQNPFSRKKFPTGDTCMKDMLQIRLANRWQKRGVDLKCQYEEIIDGVSDSYRWYESKADTVLFYLTNAPVTPLEINRHPKEEIFPSYLSRAISKSGGFHRVFKVPVIVIQGGLRNVIPRRVTFELQYYQVDAGNKRLVEANIFFDELCTTLLPVRFGGDPELYRKMEEQRIKPCAFDINGEIESNRYILEVIFFPLDWFQLLNKFQFGGAIYVGFYTLVGIISASIGVLLWCSNRIFTKLRYPPRLRGYSLLKMVATPSLHGYCLAALPILTCLWIIYFWFVASEIDGLEGIRGDWFSSSVFDQESAEIQKKGRAGLSLVVFGLYVTLYGTTLLIPSKEQKTRRDDIEDMLKEEKCPQSDLWQPSSWKRAHFVWYTLVLECLLLCVLEFSYSETFERTLYKTIAFFKFSHIFVEILALLIFKEQMLCAPLVALIGVIEIMVTMGAADFVDFTTMHFITISTAIIHRVYVDPAVKGLKSLWPRWKYQLVRSVQRRSRLTVKQKKEEELRWRRINEDIELRSEGVEPLIEAISLCSVQSISRFLSSFVYLVVVLFYDQSEIAKNYGVRENELRYYALFALCMIPWYFVIDVLSLNTQELVHGWRLYDYIVYQRHRFISREERWLLNSSNVDESISKPYQSLDLMNFSSQYYFLITLVVSGMILNMIGFTILFRSGGYNVLGDPVMPIIIAIITAICHSARLICLRLSTFKISYLDWEGVWGTQQIEGTLDDVVAAKLAIGQGRQVDLEKERRELEALNDEKFRQRFLDRNRPWIIQHIMDLVADRDKPIPSEDQMKMIDYMREIYSDLIAMGEGARREGDRSDISSDDDSINEMTKRRQWERTPQQESTIRIAKLWLNAAKKRMVFCKAIASIIDESKKSKCSNCGCDMPSEMLFVHLANGKDNSSVIDDLISEFERTQYSKRSDILLWKSFFKRKAEFITICNRCKLKKNTNGDEEIVRKAPYLTRPGDISSDEEDSITYDVLIVNKASNEGKMVAKWLSIARKKMGGHFPRDGAREVVDDYISMLKRHKHGSRKIGSEKRNTHKNNERLNHKGQWSPVKINEKSKFLMSRWVSMAKDEYAVKYEEKGLKIREQLGHCLDKMSASDDWIIGKENRLHGIQLYQEATDLTASKEREKLEEINQIKDFEDARDVFIQEQYSKLRRKEKEIKEIMNEAKIELQNSFDIRIRSLQKSLDDLQSTEHEDFLHFEQSILDERNLNRGELLKVEKENQTLLLREERITDKYIRDKEQECKLNTEEIRKSNHDIYKRKETEWRRRASEWLALASRKLLARDTGTKTKK